ncbi:MAG: S-ribosylhomocysteine lyase [Lactobacillales bacterium]|jgi:S-ribosylhomocysteine lyase|nr:S-ribosylhomocysteine lyase [Lactobacillales bacterium]
MAEVESFKLDHTKVYAPYVRVAGRDERDGVAITKFDLRFVQPNGDTIPTGALHTLEHLLATYMRDDMDNIIDISPMGCRTGFYMIVWGDQAVEPVVKALHNSLEKIVTTTVVPATTDIECGNYRDHSLFGAIEYAKQVLANGISDDPFQKR